MHNLKSYKKCFTGYFWTENESEMGKESLHKFCLWHCPHFIYLFSCFAERTSSLFKTEWIGLMFVRYPPPPLFFFHHVFFFYSSSQYSYISLKSECLPSGNKLMSFTENLPVHRRIHATPYLACNYKAAAESNFGNLSLPPYLTLLFALCFLDQLDILLCNGCLNINNTKLNPSINSQH